MTNKPDYENDRLTGTINGEICLHVPAKNLFDTEQEYLDYLKEIELLV
jgi:hypothetical protein